MSVIFRTPPAVGKLLGVDPARVIAWIRSGKLKAVNLSDRTRPRYRISQEALEEFLRQREVTTQPTRTWTRRRKPRWFPEVKVSDHAANQDMDVPQ